MREESVARRYAAALFALAQQEKIVDAVDADLTTVAMAVKGVPILRTILGEPRVTETRKKDALKAAFGGKINKATLQFLELLVDKRRIGLLPEIQVEFDRLAMRVQNIARATAITAVPLTKEEEKSLIKALEVKTGKKIELQTEVDPSVVGGVLVRIGDTVWDGTVRGNLERMRAQLLGK
jgi:F-type H+-transporting ATPase subunit delta